MVVHGLFITLNNSADELYTFQERGSTVESENILKVCVM
jgi:hypothetical protein